MRGIDGGGVYVSEDCYCYPTNGGSGRAVDLERHLVRQTRSAGVHEGAQQSGDRSGSSAERVIAGANGHDGLASATPTAWPHPARLASAYRRLFVQQSRDTSLHVLR
jgi:hypothetical protein